MEHKIITSQKHKCCHRKPQHGQNITLQDLIDYQKYIMAPSAGCVSSCRRVKFSDTESTDRIMDCCLSFVRRRYQCYLISLIISWHTTNCKRQEALLETGAVYWTSVQPSYTKLGFRLSSALADQGFRMSIFITTWKKLYDLAEIFIDPAQNFQILWIYWKVISRRHLILEETSIIKTS